MTSLKCLIGIHCWHYYRLCPLLSGNRTHDICCRCGREFDCRNEYLEEQHQALLRREARKTHGKYKP
jgi:hypothetical protein